MTKPTVAQESTRGGIEMECPECGVNLARNGCIDVENCEAIARRVHEIDGFMKGVEPGERFPGERAALKAEWERKGLINMAAGQKHYGHIQDGWKK